MNDAQRGLIAAYHDGELSSDAALEARRLLDDDPEAGRHLAALAHLDNTLRRAFDPILEQPVPAAMQTLTQPPRRQHMWISVALAASLALVAVLVVRQVSVDRKFQDQLTQMQQQIAQLRHQTLENVPSGTKASWFAPAGNARVDVTPVQTYRTPDNRYCREYEQRIEDIQGVEIRRGIACRAGKTLWSDEAMSAPAGTSL